MIDYKIPTEWITIVDTSKIRDSSLNFTDGSIYQSTCDIGASIVEKLEKGVKIVVCRDGEAVRNKTPIKKEKTPDKAFNNERYAQNAPR
jgi:hypothetical protein